MLLAHFHPGRLGALRMGVEHGGVCIGCCWTLMAALFALGVMSIAWMAFVAALIAAERLLPWKAPAVRAVAVVLAVLGLAVAFAPEQVPGLTIPGSVMDDAGDEHGRLTATLVGVGAPTRRMWVTLVAQANLRGAHDPYDQAPAYAASHDDPALPGHWRARRVDRPRRCPGVRRLPGTWRQLPQSTRSALGTQAAPLRLPDGSLDVAYAAQNADGTNTDLLTALIAANGAVSAGRRSPRAGTGSAARR